jgi:hypothetical protein
MVQISSLLKTTDNETREFGRSGIWTPIGLDGDVVGLP